MKIVVIVEAPVKAKTINKYLGDDYTVIASFGHVRDLPARDGSVRPDEDFVMEWELGDRSKRHIDEIAKAVKLADRVYLATDPDREGEAIAWHQSELLREKHLTDNRGVQRITFPAATEDGHDPRACPVCREGRLRLKLGKMGAFIGCSQYPECCYTGH